MPPTHPQIQHPFASCMGCVVSLLRSPGRWWQRCAGVRGSAWELQLSCHRGPTCLDGPLLCGGCSPILSLSPVAATGFSWAMFERMWCFRKCSHTQLKDRAVMSSPAPQQLSQGCEAVPAQGVCGLLLPGLAQKSGKSSVLLHHFSTSWLTAV